MKFVSWMHEYNNELQTCECLSVDTLTVDIHVYVECCIPKGYYTVGALQYLVLVHGVGGSYVQAMTFTSPRIAHSFQQFACSHTRFNSLL